mmetsp:Transcript_39174/g.98511  ORF Transcript_39174/g.98511 Transcript_39174/m.98511 type:complete len:237 (-) Transcript_39174:1354-2064(-)
MGERKPLDDAFHAIEAAVLVAQLPELLRGIGQTSIMPKSGSTRGQEEATVFLEVCREAMRGSSWPWPDGVMAKHVRNEFRWHILAHRHLVRASRTPGPRTVLQGHMPPHVGLLRSLLVVRSLPASRGVGTTICFSARPCKLSCPCGGATGGSSGVAPGGLRRGGRRRGGFCRRAMGGGREGGEATVDPLHVRWQQPHGCLLVRHSVANTIEIVFVEGGCRHRCVVVNDLVWFLIES